MTAYFSFKTLPSIPLPSGILSIDPSPFTIRIAPTSQAHLGDYLITITIDDTLSQVTSSFIITVFNTPPYFVSPGQI